MTRERAYYKALRRAVAAVSSTEPLKDKLSILVRTASRATGNAVSFLALDATGTKLAHTSTWGLPKFYLQKGLLDAGRSLAETSPGQPVVISNVADDARLQFPEMATRAGIVSILSVPVISFGGPVGSLRFYSREPRDFTTQDISFAQVIASLSATALALPSIDGEVAMQTGPALRRARSISFAHPSEEEFANILDFYNIEWVYEPRAFPLKTEGERVTEMFTPDFYLPGLDLYVELTTMRQALVTGKNRKLKRLRKLFPGTNISLLYKNDYARLLAKYGCGPLASSRAHGIDRVLYSSAEIATRVSELARRISQDYADRRPVIIGVQRGFLCFMADLIRQISVPLDIDYMTISYYSGGTNSVVRITKDTDMNVSGRHVILLEDIVDTGITLSCIINHLRAKNPASLAICTLLDKRARRLVDVKLDYIGFEIPDEFVVGYGLDYYEEYRNLPFIGIPEITENPAT